MTYHLEGLVDSLIENEKWNRDAVRQLRWNCKALLQILSMLEQTESKEEADGLISTMELLDIANRGQKRTLTVREGIRLGKGDLARIQRKALDRGWV